MQTKAIVGIGVLILGVIALIAFSSKKPEQEVSRKILNAEQANNAVNMLQDLTEVAFERMIARIPLEPDDIANLEEAELVINDLLDYDPVSLGFKSVKGKIELALRKYEQAEATFKNALLMEPNPKDPEYDFNVQIYAGLCADVSRLYYEKADYTKAHEYIDKAREIFPQDPRFMTDEASIHVKLNQNEKAIDLCEAALKIDPGHLIAEDIIKDINSQPSQ